MNNLYLVNDQNGDIGWLPIVASSRGQAHSIYLSDVECDDDWTLPLTIQLLATNVELPEGVDHTVMDEITFECARADVWFEEVGYRTTDRHFGKQPSGYYGS